MFLIKNENIHMFLQAYVIELRTVNLKVLELGMAKMLIQIET